MTEQERALILGAQIGVAYVPMYIEFLRGFEGTQSNLQAHMGLAKTTTQSGIQRLRDLKLLRVKEWYKNSYAVYVIGNEPDAPRPAVSARREQTERVINNRIAAQNAARDRLEKLLEDGEKTLHGTRRTVGNVTVHRMR